MKNIPQIYIASLSAYNSGILHGDWFDLTDYENKEELLEAIQDQVLSTCPTNSEFEKSEEWAIHDSDNCNANEYEDLEQLISFAKLSVKHDLSMFILQDLFCNVPDIDQLDEHISDTYKGFYESELEFTYEFIDDCGFLKQIPEHLQYYFDYEAYKRDLFIDSFCSYKENNGVHVFYRY